MGVGAKVSSGEEFPANKTYALCAYFDVTDVTALAVTSNYRWSVGVEADHANRFARGRRMKTQSTRSNANRYRHDGVGLGYHRLRYACACAVAY